MFYEIIPRLLLVMSPWLPSQSWCPLWQIDSLCFWLLSAILWPLLFQALVVRIATREPDSEAVSVISPDLQRKMTSQSSIAWGSFTGKTDCPLSHLKERVWLAYFLVYYISYSRYILAPLLFQGLQLLLPCVSMLFSGTFLHIRCQSFSQALKITPATCGNHHVGLSPAY